MRLRTTFFHDAVCDQALGPHEDLPVDMLRGLTHNYAYTKAICVGFDQLITAVLLRDVIRAAVEKALNAR